MNRGFLVLIFALLLAACSSIPPGVSREGVAGPGVVVKEGDRLPKLLSIPQPVYPKAAKVRGITGRVVLEFIVETDGRVSHVAVTESPDPLLSQAAMDAVRQARYQPGNRGGVAVRARLRWSAKFYQEENTESSPKPANKETP